MGPHMSKMQALPKILTKSMITSFDNAREELPDGRPKHTHSNGVVSLIDLEVASDSPYTGMLRPGRHRGLMRLASSRVPELDATFPGLAIKFLRTGIHSANLLALSAGGEQTGHVNFFEKPLTTHSPPPDAIDAIRKFHQVSGCRSMLGASDFTAYEEDGSRVRTPNFPYEVLFEAPDPLQFAVNAGATNKTVDLINSLKSIPSGTLLYNVFARASPSASKVFLAKLISKTPQTTSLFGDTKLFFRHQRMEEDFMMRPDWVYKIDMPLCDESVDKKGRLRPISDWQCPS